MALVNSPKASAEKKVSKRPIIGETQAVELSQRFFGFHASTVKEFYSYGDRNFYLKGKHQRAEFSESNSEEEFVLKVLNHVDAANSDFVDAQDALCLFLNKQGFECPVPLRNLNGDYNVMWKNPKTHGSSDGVIESVRMLAFVPGTLLKDVTPFTSELLFGLGRYMASFDKVAQKFSHRGIEQRVNKWDLQHFGQIEHYITNLAESTGNKDGEDPTELLKFVYETFQIEVLPRLPSLDKQIIHNDFNEANVLTVPREPGEAGYRVSGVIDFGDVCYSYKSFEVAICMAHMIMLMCEDGRSHLRAIYDAGFVLNGYQEAFPLSCNELDVVYWSVAARICQCIALGQHYSLLDPSNLYLQSTFKIAREALRYYVGIPKVDMMNIWCSQNSGRQV